MTRERAVASDYRNVLAFIDKMDNQLWSVRHLMILSVSGVIAYAVSHQRAAVLLVNVLLVLAFFVWELSFKCLHDDAIRRSNQLQDIIEGVTRGGSVPDTYQFGLGRALEVPSAKAMWHILGNRRRWHLYIPYVLSALASGIAGVVLVISGTRP